MKRPSRTTFARFCRGWQLFSAAYVLFCAGLAIALIIHHTGNPPLAIALAVAGTASFGLATIWLRWAHHLSMSEVAGDE